MIEVAQKRRGPILASSREYALRVAVRMKQRKPGRVRGYTADFGVSECEVMQAALRCTRLLFVGDATGGRALKCPQPWV